MKIHALTLTWNGEHLLKDLAPTLQSSFEFCKQNQNIQCSWYVRDNSSKDNTLSFLDEIKNKIPLKIIKSTHNTDTFSACVNNLVKIAEPKNEDYILLVNNDIIIKDNFAISNMIELQKKTKAGVVGARLLYTNTNNLQHAGVIFSKKYNTLPYHYRLNEPSDNYAKKDRYFQAVTAAFCLIKADSFFRVGGMDESYKWAFEDIDLCLKIGQTEKIAYCGSPTIYHSESASLKKNPVNKMFINPNVACFRNKWQGKYKIDHDLYLNNNEYNQI